MLAALTFLFFDSVLGQINGLRDSNGVAIHFLFFLVGSTQGIDVLQTFFSSSKSLKFFKNLELFDKIRDKILLNRLSYTTNYKNVQRKLLRNVVLSLSIYLFRCGYIVVLQVRGNPQVWRVVLAYHFSVLLGRIFVQRFLFSVQLLAHFLTIMVQILEKSIRNQPIMLTKASASVFKYYTESKHFQLRVIQKLIRLLYESSVLVNRSFDMGSVTVFFLHFLTFIYQGYIICIEVSKNEVTPRGFFIMMLSVLEVFLAHYFCQHYLKTVNRYSASLFDANGFL